jgi:hypothetical protein
MFGHTKRLAVLLSVSGVTGGFVLYMLTSCSSTGGVTRVAIEDTAYHATFDQSGKRLRKPVFQDGRTATVRFFLGPSSDPRARDAISQELSQEMRQRLQWTDATLLITLSCKICRGAPLYSQPIRYSGIGAASNEAVFEVDPDFQATALRDGKPSGYGDLAFSIILEGRYVDNFVVRAAVSMPGQVVPVPAVSPGKPSQENFQVSRESAFAPADLIITVRGGTENAPLNLAFEPVSRPMTNVFDRLAIPSDALRKGFDTGLSPAKLLDLQKNFYCSTAHLLATESEEQARLAGNCPNPGGPIKQDDGRFNRADALMFMNEIRSQGYSLYYDLFGLRDPMSELARIAFALEQAGASRVLRIQIRSDGIYLPWQILTREPTPADAMDIKDIWGMKFTLAVLPTGPKPAYPLRIGRPLRTDNSLFMTHEDNDIANAARYIVKQFAKDIDDAVPALVTSREAFYQEVGARAANLKLIFAHSHGTAGTLEASEKILFKPLDFTQPIDLYKKGNLLLNGKPLLFSSRPIVILNGCETGSSGYARQSNSSFVGVFTDFGASAVIVTDAKIPQVSGRDFGLQLLEGIRRGDEIAETVRKARAYLWERNIAATGKDAAGDPTGLLYSFYGPLGLSVAKN